MNDLCKNPMFLCAIAGIIGAVVSFMEHKFTSDEQFTPDYGRYFKILILVAGLSYGVIHFGCKGCPIKSQTGGAVENPSVLQNASNLANEAVEKIHTGNPNF